MAVFASAYYWSSAARAITTARGCGTSDGGYQTDVDKDNLLYVRAVRAF
ncbi:MAG: hypothetical protein IPJ40_16920 [Saprospirales bacterium]|nr:hypothetical protein [Saprospirales bacterium]